ncbi:MAG: TatD family hydrolase [Candidatus Paceibacterota bacterium]|jgi:TatD DNase family protein
MEIKYIDAHCHLQFEQFDIDRGEIIEQMREQGIAAIVVGCDLESSKRAVELAEKYDHLWAAIGIHPHDAHVGRCTSHMQDLHVLAERARVVAIGECGLDYFRLPENADEEKLRQKELFKQHIALAYELDKPLIIHARPSVGTQDAYHDVLALLTEAKKAHPNLRGDSHFFAGGVSEAEEFVALGFTVSFTAVITFARDYDEAICAVPLTSILAETDAPYVAPASRRGQRNDPLAVVGVVAKIAEVRDEDIEVVRAAFLANTRRIFAL